MHNASVSTEPLTNTEAASQKRSLKSNGYLLAGAAIMLLLAAFALLAPVLAPSDPNAINPVQSLKSFNFEGHLLGTDNLGRDLLSRLLYGGRITLISSVVAALISTSLGTALGLIAAYYKGWIDVIVMRLTDILMGFPFILLAILIVAALGPSTINALIAVAIANVPFTARLVKSEAARVREREFITAALALGANHQRIVLSHMLPNIISVTIPTLFMTTGWMIGQTSALSFLGLGTQPPTADWGSMLAESQNYMASLPQVAMLPGLMIVIAVVGLNLFGVGLRSSLMREE
ncbi:ABC-type dipeptide/oligopeptide/nickel transport system, permease component [Deinococcus peraridilitoris DSM 19664]|uniref:ABC-type dipeptide/oligopeptide/nickel transport system, permease component n=1 Tax=Deinococcus peraridilitoris (strain DSM 19664 / LMG 22246 / CIP 109416 / KR-200) TaxID=937777 RepID=K9ZZB1_DEIPD|nr:ABC-type dipeptide/oligopeptide/nickel transport system, permease component [Deinococcus peraridilitoris DSM 19664]